MFPHRIKLPRRIRNRSGVVALLAMVFLVLTASMAVGIYYQAGTSVSIADNEQYIGRSFNAAEAGMQFIRFQMLQLSIPYNATQSTVATALWTQLQAQLNNTRNMNDSNGACHNPTLSTDASGNDIITIPGMTGAAHNWMTIDSVGGQCYIKITQSGVTTTVKVVGQNVHSQVTPIARAVQLQYGLAENASAIFDYGVASKGEITMNGNTKVTGLTASMGSVLAATAGAVPLSMTGNPSISGDFSYTNAAGAPSYGGGTIAGYADSNPNFSQHVHAGVTPPTFPTIDTAAFAQYVPGPAAAADGTTVISSSNGPSGKNFSNIRIKANANPSFTANTTIQGVVYVETPNQIFFAGNTTIQGVIVVQDNPVGSAATNSITFKGNVSVSGVGTLPASYGTLTQLTGSFLLAPAFDVSFGGNFGTVNGSIIADQMSFSGNAGGTIDGSVIVQQDTGLSLQGNTDLIISSQSTTNYPAGVYFSNHFAPLPSTYAEVNP